MLIRTMIHESLSSDVYVRYSHRGQKTYCAAIVNRKGHGVHDFDNLMDIFVQQTTDDCLESNQSDEQTCIFRCNRWE